MTPEGEQEPHWLDGTGVCWARAARGLEGLSDGQQYCSQPPLEGCPHAGGEGCLNAAPSGQAAPGDVGLFVLLLSAQPRGPLQMVRFCALTVYPLWATELPRERTSCNSGIFPQVPRQRPGKSNRAQGPLLRGRLRRSHGALVGQGSSPSSALPGDRVPGRHSDVCSWAPEDKMPWTFRT